ncbi:hypothetical protein G3O08_13155 [Cryomorpha ignava]|uniref:Anti-sigma factor n=1 Tax=Cryomorpha ignava TaxID=101383 RepID=A0A7K3WS09_9FLAO|nr:hypothetical protein [Cryomorpha ignava]NEN24453.1 hypothetical protein [Cryomorpha ignava]
MDEFEKYMRENEELFNNDEPAEGHEARFLHKLKQADEKKAKSAVDFWRVAAAIILLLVLAASVLIPRFNSPQDVQYSSMSLSDVSEDMANVELYYKSKLAAEYEKIDDLSKTDPLVKAYLDEIDTLNEEYQNLEATLYKSGTHDKVVLAMIENFRLRLALMEKLEAKKLNKTNIDSL